MEKKGLWYFKVEQTVIQSNLASFCKMVLFALCRQQAEEGEDGQNGLLCEIVILCVLMIPVRYVCIYIQKEDERE